MTEQNWVNMVRKSVSGPGTNTCFPAAMDCLLEDRDIPEHVYHRYRELYRLQAKFGVRAEYSLEAFRMVLWHSIDTKDMNRRVAIPVTERAEFITLLDGCRGLLHVIIQLVQHHDVGLKPVGRNRWQMVGNGVSTAKEFQTGEIFGYIYIPELHEIDNQYNVMLIG